MKLDASDKSDLVDPQKHEFVLCECLPNHPHCWWCCESEEAHK